MKLDDFIMTTIISAESGVYAIRNKVNGLFYIGSAKNMAARIRVHRCELNNGYHKNIRLQRAWSHYKEEMFEFFVLDKVPVIEITDREQWFLDNFRPFDTEIGYNISTSAYHPRLGMKHTPESIWQMSYVKRGIKPAGMSKEGRARVTASVVAANKGKKRTPEQVKRLSDANRKKFRSPEWCQAISDGQRGKIIPQEQRDRIAATLTGRRASEKTKQKLSASLRAAFSTPEQKLRRSNAMKVLWSNPDFKKARIELVVEARRKRKIERMAALEKQ